MRKPEVIALTSGFVMLLIFIYYTFIKTGYFYSTFLIYAIIPLFLGVVQIKVKHSLYIIIPKYLFSIIIILYYMLMFIALAVPNYELKHITFKILLVMSLFAVILSGIIEIKMYKAKKLRILLLQSTQAD